MIAHGREIYQPTSRMGWDRGSFDGSSTTVYIYGCVKVGGTPDHPKLDQFLVLSNEFMFFGIHFMNPPYGIDRNIVVEYRNNSLWPVWTAMTMWNFFGGETYEKMVLPVLSPDPYTNVA
jgi:hypothetical protein